MLKLHQYFLRTSALFATIGLIAVGWLNYYFVKNEELNSAKTMLMTLSNMLGENPIKSSWQNIAQKSHIRITYIDSNASVRYNSRSNAKQPEDLLNKTAMQEIKAYGMDDGVHYSKVAKDEYIYVIKKVDGGYLRISLRLKPLYAQIYSLVTKITLLYILLFILLFYFSAKMGQKIAKDSQEIDDALEALLNKNFSIYLGGVRCCKEFKQIAKKLEKVAKKLKKREKQKTKYTGRLKEITKRQGDIISAISHEFKNPVAAIVGYAQTLIETPDLDNSLKKKFLSKIESNANKISSMIDTLSLSIKLENSTITLNKSRFNLHEVAKSTQEMLMQKYKNREIILECEDLHVLADRNMLENVFINLIENALKYSSDAVVVKCDTLRVRVIDNGIGIDKSDQEKIKRKFYRVDDLVWNNSIGVGLYIVDYILKLHGLDLDIESAGSGKGSEFSFNIEPILEQ